MGFSAPCRKTFLREQFGGQTWASIPLEWHKSGPVLANTALALRTRIGDTPGCKPTGWKRQEGAGITLAWLLQVSVLGHPKWAESGKEPFCSPVGRTSWGCFPKMILKGHQRGWWTPWLPVSLVLLTSHIWGTHRTAGSHGNGSSENWYRLLHCSSCMGEAESSICRARQEFMQNWKDGHSLSLYVT